MFFLTWTCIKTKQNQTIPSFFSDKCSQQRISLTRTNLLQLKKGPITRISPVDSTEVGQRLVWKGGKVDEKIFKGVKKTRWVHTREVSTRTSVPYWYTHLLYMVTRTPEFWKGTDKWLGARFSLNSSIGIYRNKESSHGEAVVGGAKLARYLHKPE